LKDVNSRLARHYDALETGKIEGDITQSKAFVRSFVQKMVIDGNNMKRWGFCPLYPQWGRGDSNPHAF
jgi:hypothetical protein